MTDYDLNRWVSRDNRIAENSFPTEDEMYEMIDGKYVVEDELAFEDYVDALESYGAHSRDIAEVMTDLGFNSRPLEELTLEVSDYRAESGGKFMESHRFEREMDWDRVQALRSIVAMIHDRDETQLIPQ